MAQGVISTIQQAFARTMWALRAGTSFGGNRDLYQVFGYNNSPVHQNFVAKYLRQDLAQRVINAFPDAVWTENPVISGGSAFDKVWTDLISPLSYPIFPTLRKLDIFAGLGQFAVLVIGLDDGGRLDTPISASAGRVNKLLYLQPYLEGSVAIDKFDSDTSSPRFGMPEMYSITPGDAKLQQNSAKLMSQSRTPFRVHWTRALHIAEGTLENLVFGHSRLEAVYNTLDDIQKVVGGSAEAFWLMGNRGLHVDVDKEMEMDEDDADNLTNELDEYMHQLRRVIRTRGVKVEALGSDVADPTGPFTALMALLSAQSRIPQRVLMGAEAGQLASQQDRANWSIAVKEHISAHEEPVVFIPFIQAMIRCNVLPVPKALTIEWPETFKMNPLERAQTAAQQARSLTNVARGLSTMQDTTGDLISIEEAREIVAPGVQVLSLKGLPKGQFLPKLSQPKNEPIPPIDPNLEKQIELQKESGFGGGGGFGSSGDGTTGDTSVGTTPTTKGGKKPTK